MAILDTTSADAQLILTADGLYAAVAIEGFMPDAMWSSDAIDTADTGVGADGLMYAGWVPALVPYTISLQAGSPSHDIFEGIDQYETSYRTKVSLSMSLWLPSAQRVYTFRDGVLKNLKKLPDGGKILQGRSYVTNWASKNVTFAPV
jgi:hypothetical protein